MKSQKLNKITMKKKNLFNIVEKKNSVHSHLKFSYRIKNGKFCFFKKKKKKINF